MRAKATSTPAVPSPACHAVNNVEPKPFMAPQLEGSHSQPTWKRCPCPAPTPRNSKPLCTEYPDEYVETGINGCDFTIPSLEPLADYDTPLPSIEDENSDPISPPLTAKEQEKLKELSSGIPLTVENFRAFAEATGTELPTNPLASTAGSAVSNKTVTIGYDSPQYEEQLQYRGIYFNPSDEPSNFKHIREGLGKTRESPPPKKDVVEKIYNYMAQAPNEGAIIQGVVLPVINAPTIMYENAFRVVPAEALWSKAIELPSRAESKSTRIAPPKPDHTIGYSRKDGYQDISLALDRLGAFARPLTVAPDVLFPCFTIEAKGFQPGEYSRRQNRHNAAVMLRGLRILRAAASDEATTRRDFDGKSHVLTLSVTTDVIDIHCHWTKMAPHGLEFYSCMVKGWAAGDKHNWGEMIQWVRNAITWTIDHNSFVKTDMQTLQQKLLNATGPPLGIPAPPPMPPVPASPASASPTTPRVSVTPPLQQCGNKRQRLNSTPSTK
ncbi:hypothetical protein K432DRAFT_471380 [Lepidopterella palustris CBS 459.81]|uniref:DUF7924 domain-containing protein n=1 Tax=Lepidopterella palustris CBS 459.81 TaxID=1314670 RepID=A0A8E2DYM2_9PEZI|nr:hypothetical protein K432DRAFT_471380 [Lepidopterella palustris CBS 459.81]